MGSWTGEATSSVERGEYEHDVVVRGSIHPPEPAAGYPHEYAEVEEVTCPTVPSLDWDDLDEDEQERMELALLDARDSAREEADHHAHEAWKERRWRHG